MPDELPPMIWQDLHRDINRCLDDLIPSYTEDMDLTTRLVQRDSPVPGRRRWVIQIEDMRDEVTERNAE